MILSGYAHAASGARSAAIAAQLQLSNVSLIKCIAAGHICIPHAYAHVLQNLLQQESKSNFLHVSDAQHNVDMH